MICGGLFLLSVSAFAAHENEWVGKIHNDRDRHLTTFNVGGERFELDYGGLNLYGTAERYDRDQAAVRGVIGGTSRTGYPTIQVSSITFNPYGSAVTYNIGGGTSNQYYTNYDRDYRYPRNYENDRRYRDRNVRPYYYYNR